MAKIGLAPLSAKPYHRGHHALVLKAAQENDEVILFISTSDRVRKNEFPIYGADMERVWKEELEPIMPPNVILEYGGSPVRKVYEFVGDACEHSTANIFTIYSDPVDTINNYPAQNREKYMQPLFDLGQVVFAAEKNPDDFTRGIGTPDIRGEDLRKTLSSANLEEFASLLPEGVNAKRIYDILSGKNRLIKDFVAAVIK